MREGTCGSQHKFNSLPNIKQDETYHLLMAVTLVPCSLPPGISQQGCHYFLVFSVVPNQPGMGHQVSESPACSCSCGGSWRDPLWPWHPLILSHCCWVTRGTFSSSSSSSSSSFSLEDETCCFSHVPSSHRCWRAAASLSSEWHSVFTLTQPE